MANDAELNGVGSPPWPPIRDKLPDLGLLNYFLSSCDALGRNCSPGLHFPFDCTCTCLALLDQHQIVHRPSLFSQASILTSHPYLLPARSLIHSSTSLFCLIEGTGQTSKPSHYDACHHPIVRDSRYRFSYSPPTACWSGRLSCSNYSRRSCHHNRLPPRLASVSNPRPCSCIDTPPQPQPSQQWSPSSKTSRATSVSATYSPHSRGSQPQY